MQHDFWQQKWARGEIGFHHPRPNPCLTDHWHRLQLPKRARVLVPLCGKSVDLWWLRQQGHEVIGVELCEQAAQQFWQEAGIRPQHSLHGPLERYHHEGLTYWRGDLLRLTREQCGPVDAIFDRAALVALPGALRLDYLRHLEQLAPSAQRLLVTLDYPQSQMAGPPFAIAPAYLRQQCSATFRLTLLDSRDGFLSEPKLRERGLDTLREQVWHLQPRSESVR